MLVLLTCVFPVPMLLFPFTHLARRADGYPSTEVLYWELDCMSPFEAATFVSWSCHVCLGSSVGRELGPALGRPL